MPYRKLPKTDSSRLKALETILSIDKMTFPGRLLMVAFSECRNSHRLLTENLRLYKLTKQELASIKKRKASQVKITRLFLSHFIQVLYLCVIRKEIKPQELKGYGLLDLNMKLPSLNSEEELIAWAEKVISGEQQRVSRGSAPIYTPSISKVLSHLGELKKIKQAYELKARLLKKKQEEVYNLRAKTDLLINQIWESIEGELRTSYPEDWLARSQQFGVNYYYRKHERSDNTASTVL